MFGVAAGKWIVAIDWVHHCIKDNKFVNEGPFEVLDFDGEDGPRRSRKNGSENLLFESFEFCCQNNFSDMAVNDFNQLLQLCGAITRADPSEFTKSRRHTMFVVETNDLIGLEVQRKAISLFDKIKVVSVSREWVLDCISAHKIFPIRSHLIGKYSESFLKCLGFNPMLTA